jgi:hypothetical protein
VADYQPVFLPGLLMTSTAASPVTGGDPVEVAGSGLVQRATGAAGSLRYLGVAAQDAAALAPVTIILGRVVHEGPADGPVTAGDLLTTSPTPGCQVKTCAPPAADLGSPYDRATASAAVNAAVTAALAVIGVALITAPNGSTVRWAQT